MACRRIMVCTIVHYYFMLEGQNTVLVQAWLWDGDTFGGLPTPGTSKECMSLLVLLNSSVAFNIIDHCILLGHLSGMGLGGIILYWLQSFLKWRTQILGES